MGEEQEVDYRSAAQPPKVLFPSLPGFTLECVVHPHLAVPGLTTLSGLS